MVDRMKKKNKTGSLVRLVQETCYFPSSRFDQCNRSTVKLENLEPFENNGNQPVITPIFCLQAFVKFGVFPRARAVSSSETV